MEKRRWLNVELTVGQAVTFGYYLRKHDIKHEKSACYNLIHFEVYVNEEEQKECDNYLDYITHTL